jgi:fatty acid desaturase
MNYQTNSESAKTAAAAATALIIVGLLAMIALAFLWTPPPL